jgi:predicted ATP-dependent endonuclease of OLD family
MRVARRKRFVKAVGYKMIKELRIKNFRCFQTLELSNLGRINVIVGDNGRGKTALLEGIYLAGGGGPELYLRTLLWRGLVSGEVQVSTSRESYEGFFRGLFYRYDHSQNIEIEFTDSESRFRTLKIYYPQDETLALPLEISGPEVSIPKPITFHWRTGSGMEHKAQVEIRENQLVMPPFSEVLPLSFLNTASLLNPNNTATPFSDLSKKRQLSDVLEAMKTLYPQIEDLSLEIDFGRTIVFASVKNLPEKIPLAILSGGINRFLSYLVTISTRQKGIVLIDEIENGIYFRKLPDMWICLRDLCRKNDTQLFVTTHSKECLESLLPAISGHEDIFMLLRAEQQDSKSHVAKFSGINLEAALEEGFEIR